MTTTQVQTNMEKVNQALARYMTLTRRTPEEVAERQGGKLEGLLWYYMKDIAPPRGKVRTMFFQGRKIEGGLHISDRVRKRTMAKLGMFYDTALNTARFSRYDKATGKRKSYTIKQGSEVSKFNLQQILAENEISAREAASGFMAISTRFQAGKLKTGASAVSKYGKMLAQAGITTQVDSATVTFKWGGFSEQSERAAEGLLDKRPSAALAGALQHLAADIAAYVPSHMRKVKAEAGLS